MTGKKGDDPGSSATKRYTRWEGPKRERSHLDRVAGILELALSRKGLDEDLKRYRFVSHWPAIIGIEAAKRCRPIRVKNGVLFVEVNDSAWLQELSFQKQTILDRIQELQRDQTPLTDIFFRVSGSARCR